ncbi:NACHT and WD domain-containing protein, variant [Coniochaeta sp. 2T2.1]|nr:NACHT and WD domain-containing protein, variant [Coniochaeta sp. 2T2.1]
MSLAVETMFKNRFKSSSLTEPPDNFAGASATEHHINAPLTTVNRDNPFARPVRTESVSSSFFHKSLGRTITGAQLASALDTNTGLDPLGLQIAFEPHNPGGDIVFVHGLGGSAWRTWCWERELKNFWPQWLVQDEPFSTYRISTFGYNARFKGQATNLDIIDFAKDLLLQLYTTLCENGAPAGPIIFIAHSMGGLVVKKAYMLGKHDRQFSELVSRVFGIIFLATPHRGAEHAKVLNNILSAAPFGAPPKAYVAELERQSSSISDINENFRQQCEELSLVSFYETLKTNMHVSKVLIVEKDSAVLGYPNEVSASMDADHHSICKFKDRSDPNFIKLRSLLRSWILRQMELDRPPLLGRESSYAEILKRAQSILGIHQPGESDSNLQFIKSLLVDGSGRWLQDKMEFQAWVNRETRDELSPLTFWMIGLPGKGKTVLSASVINHLQSRDHRVQFHLFSQGHQNRRSIAYCLRAIAAQLAEQIPSFREALVDFHEETSISFKSDTQTFQYLWEKIFVGIIFKLRLDKPLWWILDGTDESDNPSLLITSLKGIRSCTPIKVYLSSRPLKFVSLLDKARLTSYFLQDSDTAHDVRVYTENAVRNEIPDDPALQKYVSDKILSNATGSFLWVRLALETLENNWYTREAIEAALTNVPRGMVAMYKRMVESINAQQPRNRDMAQLILTWAACSWRPLTLDEIRIALEPEYKDFTNFAVTINQICGHFINIERSSNATQVVSLIHATAREFLLKGDDTTAPFIDAKEAHKAMAIHCLNYLSNDRWRRYFSSIHMNMSMGKKKGRGRVVFDDSTCPFLTYATCYWAYHVSKAPSGAPDLLKALHVFLNNYCLSWVEGIALAGNLQYISRAAQYLKAHVKRAMRRRSITDDPDQILSLKDSQSDLDWVQAWAVDLIRVVGKYGSNLLRNPPSIYKHVPAFCPKESMIGKAYGSSPSRLLTVEGLPSETWDDCLASVNIGREDSASQVIATESFFLTLANASGTVVVWSAETCEKVKTIRQGEWVTMMALSHSGTLLATSGYRNFCVWEVSSGRQIDIFPRKSESTVRDLKFSHDDGQLLIGLDNCTVAYHNLKSGQTDRVFVARPPENDTGYVGCPGNVVISPDLTKVAMSWRGRAPLVWDLDHGDSLLPYTCRVKGPNDPLLYPQQLWWQPETGYLLVLCNDTRLVEWRILDEYQIEYDHIGARDIAVSDDGNFLLSRDNNGTINIWTFPRYNLVYSLLNTNEPSCAMVFSPNCQRFYDIRGSVCNVWEPDALVRPDEQDLEDTSSSGGSFAVTEPITSAAGSDHILITSLGMTADDKYFCYGREDGSVIIVDAHSGKRLRKVYNHSSPGDVLALSWSETGKYMVSCDEFGQVIAKRLQSKEQGKWAVFAAFETNLKENALQLLFSPDEKLLLISTPSEDFIWDLKAKKEVLSRAWGSNQARYWIQHPSDASELLWVEPSFVRVFKWPTLEQQKQCRTAPTLETASNGDTMRQGRALEPEPPTSRQPSRAPDHDRTVQWATTAQADSHHILIYATLPQERTVHWASDISQGGLQISILNLVDLDSTPSPSPSSTLLPPNIDTGLSLPTIPVPPLLVQHIKFLIGAQGTSIVFLDHEGWLSTWDITTPSQSEDIETVTKQPGGGGVYHHHHRSAVECDIEGIRGLTRHFFAPRDWLNTNTSHLTVVHGQGALFCPRYGEVAIVRGGMRM